MADQIPDGARAFPGAMDGTAEKKAGAENSRPESASVVNFQDATLHREISEAMDEIARLEQERKAINAQVQEIREQVKAKGVNLQAFDLARKFWKMDGDQRQAVDFSLQLCRKAKGIGLQQELFDSAAGQPTGGA